MHRLSWVCAPHHEVRRRCEAGGLWCTAGGRCVCVWFWTDSSSAHTPFSLQNETHALPWFPVDASSNPTKSGGIEAHCNGHILSVLSTLHQSFYSKHIQMPIFTRRLLTNTTDITSRKSFTTEYVATLIQENSALKWKRTGPLKSSFVSTMSSLATSSSVCSEGIDRILLISTKLISSVSLSARACRREWSEARHSCGETTRASSRAHRRACAIAEWMSRRVH